MLYTAVFTQSRRARERNANRVKFVNDIEDHHVHYNKPFSNPIRLPYVFNVFKDIYCLLRIEIRELMSTQKKLFLEEINVSQSLYKFHIICNGAGSDLVEY